MLDDLKLIAGTDRHDALGAAQRQLDQLVWDDYQLPELPFQPINTIVIAAMGGSAWSADFVRTWLADRLSVPISIVRDYTLPAFVNEQTLFIAMSNSGNTEETLTAFNQAVARKAHIFTIAAGGKLIEESQKRGYRFVKTPSGHEPRFAVFYAIRVLVDLLEQLGMIQRSLDELKAAVPLLKAAVEGMLPDVALAKNPAKLLARELAGRSIVVYSSTDLAVAAYRWKMQFNENAKQIAFTGTYPEFCHNEFTGWSGQPIERPYSLIELRYSFDHPRIVKRFELSAKLLSGMMPAPEIVTASGASSLEQRLWLVLYGDFVSLYLAVLNGVDAMPVPYVDKLKAALQDS